MHGGWFVWEVHVSYMNSVHNVYDNVISLNSVETEIFVVSC